MNRPISAITVANHIVEKYDVSNLYLQKLLYFIQNNYMIQNDGDLLFEETFQKWKLGPVIPNVYHAFKEFGTSVITNTHTTETITIKDGVLKLVAANETLDNQQIDFINKCMKDLINYNKFQLVEFTHQHPHWKNDERNILNGTKHLEYDYNELYNYFKKKPEELLVKLDERN